MGWTNMPATDGTDWADLAFRRQFVEAIRERRFALGPYSYYGAAWGDVPMPAAGDLAADCAYDGNNHDVVRMQDIVNGMAPYFCPPGDYAGQAYGPSEYPHYTLAELWAAAGVNPGGFTRKFPREITSLTAYGEIGWRARLPYAGTPPYVPTGHVYYEYDTAWEPAEDQASLPDILTDYGSAEIGDYVGPWLFNELRACLDLMTCAAHTLSAGPYTLKGGDSASYPITWAAALIAYAAWWVALGDPSSGDPGNYPVAYSVAGASPGYREISKAYRQTCEFEFAYRPSAELGHLSCDAAFYVVAGKSGHSPNDTFDDQGDNVADGVAALAETQNGIDAGQAEIVSDLFPAGAANVAPMAPVEPAEWDSTSTGYIVSVAFVVMDFAVAGGFEYVAEA